MLRSRHKHKSQHVRGKLPPSLCYSFWLPAGCQNIIEIEIMRRDNYLAWRTLKWLRCLPFPSSSSAPSPFPFTFPHPLSLSCLSALCSLRLLASCALETSCATVFLRVLVVPCLAVLLYSYAVGLLAWWAGVYASMLLSLLVGVTCKCHK